MMKTAIKFFVNADEAIAKGKNFQHFGAAAVDKITAHEIQVRERCSINSRLIWRQPATRSGSRLGKVY